LESKIRKYYIDLLRVLACIAVICIHVTAVRWYDVDVNSYSWQVLNTFNSMSRWAVPIFLMISGGLLLTKEKLITIKLSFTKYIPRIIFAILFFGIASYLCIDLLIQNNFDDSVLHYIKSILKGNNYFHLNYLYMLLGLYIITPILHEFVKKVSKKTLEYLLSIIFISTFCIPFLGLLKIDYIYNIISDNYLLLKFPIASGYILYYLLGFYIETYDIKWRKTVYVLGILGLLFTIFATSFYSVHYSNPYSEFYSYITPNCLFVSIALYVYIKSKSKEIKDFFLEGNSFKICSTISKYSFGIYGLHVIFVNLLDKLNIFNVESHTLVTVPLNVLLVMMMSLIASSLLCKIKWFKNLLV